MVNLAQYRLEPLHRGGEFILYRGLRQSKAEVSPPSILALSPAMEPPAPASIRKIEHEFSLKEELNPAWAIQPIALTHEQSRTMLVFEDRDAEPLDRVLGQPMELKQFLRCAIGLTAALGQVHRRGLIHKDIKPSNVLANAALDHAWLMGFGIASQLPRERQSAEPPEYIAGTLAYMAPEQTGRMNRSIDSRSDLYALGVTLYELSTGSLPFTASNPMEWVHCHIARQPLTPAERLQAVPRSVSAIIMKLLAKTPEDRYQTAAGVEWDLRRCLEHCDREGVVHEFAAGEHDRPDRILIPEKLYGRGQEVETLLASFDRVVTTGKTELVLVSGYSGIGKSSVVSELHKVLVAPRGLFASGKFDLHKRHIPYSTLGQALQSLTRRLLPKKEAELATWGEAMRDALGPNGRLMVDLVPELKLIIGEQPPVADLPPPDAQRRFQLLLRQCISVFARPEHPLALFLDDLQWIDSATLDVLEILLTQADVRHLLIIGAYRDNEVDAAHPLAQRLENLRKAGANINEIKLTALSLTNVAQLMGDALHSRPEAMLPLARSVYARTAGNPFFTIQFISALDRERLLAFDHGSGRWSWDLERIRAKKYTDNVVDLMVGRLRQLSAPTQKTLQELACLGNEAQGTTLSVVCGTVAARVHSDLFEAVRAELVERKDDSYKFVHDRIQEAAYSLIPERLRPEAHLRIGRLLLAHTPSGRREEAIFEIVNQLNHAVALIRSKEEREQLAELNLIAGQRATASAAYASALTYFVRGATLLSEDSWERRHDLAFALELNRAECEYVTGQLGATEERLSALATHAATVVEQAAVASLRMDLHLAIGQFSRAIAVGLDCLRDMGVKWSPHPGDEEVRSEYERIWSRLGTRAIEELTELPILSDPASLATLGILVKLAPCAFALDSNLHAVVSCHAVKLSVERGNSAASCYAYVWLGALACARFGDYQAGYRFGRVGCDLIEQRGWQRFQPSSHSTFGSAVIPWARPVTSGRDFLFRAFEGANRIGDVLHTRGTPLLTSNMLAAGDRLADVEHEAQCALDIALKAQFVMSAESIKPQVALVRTLRGLNRQFGCLDNEHFTESAAESLLASNPGFQSIECWYWIRKLQARFFAGDYAGAIEAASRAQLRLKAMASAMFFEAAEYHFFSALSHSARCESVSHGDPQQQLEIVATHKRQLDLWAQNCPENFENRAALLDAEIARIEGRDLDAMRRYEKAIHSARENGFVHNEALAYELAARFYASRGFNEVAHLYLRNARLGYLRWGADGKVRQLDQLHPHLSQDEPSPSSTGTIEAPVGQLDVATVIELSQALSGEMVLEKLIDRLMRAAIEHAGAERGLLISLQSGELQIDAEATARGEAAALRVSERAASIAAALPESVIRYAMRTREAVILDDASSQTPFSTDPYIVERRARSILCLPLINQGELAGILYLENNLTPRVFTRERITVLKTLASQAAISLENTRLYRDLEDREARIRRLVDANIIGIFVGDLEGRIFEANDAFLRIIGYDREDLVSNSVSWIELTPPEWRERNVRTVAELTSTGTAHIFEKEYFRKDGSRVPVLIGAALFKEGGNEAVVFVLDLTERKRAEEARRESERRWRSAIDGIPGLLAILAPNGVVENVNSQILDYCGQSLEELRNWGTNGTVHPEDLPHVIEVFTGSIASGVPYEFEARLRRFDGVYRWFDVRGVPVRDASDRIVRWYSLLTDIEDRTRAMARLQQMQSDFAHMNRVSIMGELAASLSHEISQPIATARNNARAALNFLEKQPPELGEVREALGCVVGDADRAGGIVERIRDQIKKVPPRKGHFDLNAAIVEVLGLAQSAITKYGVSVQTRLADRLSPVEGDRIQLQQVALNLILNAAEAMGSVETGPRALLITTEQDHTGVRVAVRDSGPGIDRQDLERVFESFYTTKPDGIGMGLSVCRSIIDAHGGRLWAEANESRGAVFQFTLPGRSLGAGV